MSICDERVELCRLVIESKPATASVPQPRAWQQAEDVKAVLDSLPRVARAADQVDRDLAGWAAGPASSAPPGRASARPSA